jgi:uncharacterized protein (DUF58 family)
MPDLRTEIQRWHDWTDPDFFMQGRQRERRFISLFLRQILPRQMQRTKLTLTGWMLIFVSLGIGSAAYNTSSNILFMTLALLLSSLVLSGLLSMINFRKLHWHLRVPEHLQVGELAIVEVALQNNKRIFPSMSLAFQVSHSGSDSEQRLYLAHGLAAQDAAALDWPCVPSQRGRFELCLHGVESKFPFGFLLKGMGDLLVETVWVWPARVDYDFIPTAAGHRLQTGVSGSKAGAGNDLLNLRKYERGDAPRLIHWKATARMNQLMVRQFAHEGESGFHLWLNPDRIVWSASQFETLCSVCRALAEDLFHRGRLDSVRVGAADTLVVAGLRELHGFFDQLARLELPRHPLPHLQPERSAQQVITFKPCGESGVLIYVNATTAGQA